MSKRTLFLVIHLSLVFSINTASDYCSDRFSVVSDLSQEDCDKLGPGHYYKENSNECFPSCVYVEDISFECGECPPGYICPEDESTPTCQLVEETPCFKYYVHDDNTNWHESREKPTCLSDGTFAPKQCKGEETNGRCFCYDSIGNRIYGSAFSANAANMTCACSRKRVEMEKDPEKNWFVSLHCDEMGNYESLQCQLGECWCVEPQTGDLVSLAVPENMMRLLPCYNINLHGDKYLRQCESNLYATALIKRELSIHGTTQINFKQLMCDPDGNYGTYRIHNGLALCTWKDNESIGSWQSYNLTLIDFNCYCARDSIIFKNEGVAQNLICDPLGSYKPEQKEQNGNRFYCIDKDGFQKSDLVDEAENCSIYAEY